MSGRLPQMLPAYGGQETDCISPLRKHSLRGRPDPFRHALLNGVCPGVLLGGRGVPWPTGVLFLAQTTQREKLA